MLRYVFFAYLCVLFSITLIMGLALHSVVPLEIALEMNSSKELMLAVLLLLAGMLWVFSGARANIVFCLISAVYPIYYLIVAGLRKDEFSLATLIILAIWFLFIGFLSRYWLKSDLYKWVVGALGLGLTSLMIWGGVSFAIYGGSIDTFSGRLALGFENPNVYAQIPFVILLCGAWLLVDSSPKVRNSLVVVLWVVAMMLSTAAVSRSGLIGALVFFLFYFVKDFQLRLLAIFLSIIVIVFMLSATDEVDSVSSGRLTIWAYFIGTVLDQGFSSFFFGAFQNPVLADLAPSYSRLHDPSEGVSRLFRSDNIYIQMWVEGGVFALLIFLIYIFYLFRNRLKLPARLRTVWEATMVSCLVQGFFISNMFAFYAPVPLFLLMVTALPIYFRSNTSPPVGVFKR
jgi:hypothetical protein